MMDKETAAMATRLMDLRSFYAGLTSKTPFCNAKSTVMNFGKVPYFCTRAKGHEGPHVAHLVNGDLCNTPPWTEEGLLWEK